MLTLLKCQNGCRMLSMFWKHPGSQVPVGFGWGLFVLLTTVDFNKLPFRVWFLSSICLLVCKLIRGAGESLWKEHAPCQINKQLLLAWLIKQQHTCERFMASLAQLSTSLWRSSVKVPFLWWGADMVGARHWDPPWLWPRPPEPPTALVLLVPVRRNREEGEEKQIMWDITQTMGWNCMNANVCPVGGCYMVTEASLGQVSMSTWSCFNDGCNGIRYVELSCPATISSTLLCYTTAVMLTTVTLCVSSLFDQ